MIVTVSIDEIAITIDSDGDQGDWYAPDVTNDILTRASREAFTLWVAANNHAAANFPTEDDTE